MAEGEGLEEEVAGRRGSEFDLSNPPTVHHASNLYNYDHNYYDIIITTLVLIFLTINARYARVLFLEPPARTWLHACNKQQCSIKD